MFTFLFYFINLFKIWSINQSNTICNINVQIYQPSFAALKG
jgi:hypothetical protein